MLRKQGVAIKLPPTMLYLGMRGELPPSFWEGVSRPCAVTTSFFSCSTSRDEPTVRPRGFNRQPVMRQLSGARAVRISCESQAHMQSDKAGNVLLELQCTAYSELGFHYGADVAMLSQFPHEQEVLFPPGTMLTVTSQAVPVTDPSGKAYQKMSAHPTFI